MEEDKEREEKSKEDAINGTVGVFVNKDAAMTNEDVDQENVHYNVRSIDRDLQAGMAEEEAANKEKHKYAPKARNTLKTTRKPSPDYEVKVAPPNQKARLPYDSRPMKMPEGSRGIESKQGIIDLKDYEIMSPAQRRPATPWPFYAQESIESPDKSLNTQRSMEEKKTAPEKKPAKARTTPNMQKNLFADKYFESLKGKFEEVVDNSAAVESRLNQLNNKFDELVKQNHAHFSHAGTVRREHKQTETLICEVGKKVNKAWSEVHMMKQRLCILEKCERIMEVVQNTVQDLPKACKDAFVDHIEDGCVQVRCDYDKVREIMNQILSPHLMEHTKNKVLMDENTMKVVIDACIKEYKNEDDEIAAELNKINKNLMILQKDGSTMSDDAFLSIVERTLHHVLGTNKLHNVIKCAVAEKLAEVFKNNMLKKSVTDACKENFDAMRIHMENMLRQVIRQEQARQHADIMGCMEEMGQANEARLDTVLTRVEHTQTQVHNRLKSTFDEVNELRAATDHNTKHFEMSMVNSHKANRQLLKEHQNNTNVGQAEILSVLGDTVTAMSELSEKLTKNINLNDNDGSDTTSLMVKVSELESVMKSFDGHITDMKGEIKLIPVLHKTMKEIVYVMNTTLGEELIREDDDKDEDIEMKEVATKEDKTVEVPKQRAARRQGGKGKKK